MKTAAYLGQQEGRVRKETFLRVTIEMQHDNREAEDVNDIILPERNKCLTDINRSPDNHLFISFRTPSPMILLT